MRQSNIGRAKFVDVLVLDWSSRGLSCDLSLIQNVIDRKPYPEDENLVEVKFGTTPIMSTYLVAFVIGEYDFVESQSSDGVTVRVYTPVGKAEQGKFALEVRASFPARHFISTDV